MFRLIAISMVFLAAAVPGGWAGYAQASDAFVSDSKFWNSNWRPDNMGRQNHHGHLRAERALALDNGDVIVAGMVPPSTGDPDWTRNLGLARYDRNGFHTGWQTVVYPDNDTVRYFEVKDILLSPGGTRLLVLLSELDPSDNTWRARLLRFNVSTGVLFESVVLLDVAGEDYFPAGMALYPGPQHSLAIGGFALVGSTQRPVLQRVDIGSFGEVQSVHQPVLVQADPCGSAVISCRVDSIAVAAGSLGQPRIYLGGTIIYPGPPAKDYFAIRVFLNGQADSSFAASGLSLAGFDEPGSSNDDELAAIIAYHTASIASPPTDRIFLVGTVDRACKTGIGVVRLDHKGSHLFSDFGDSGKVLFGGGSDNSGPICALANAQTAAGATFSPPDRLVIVGQTIQGGVCVGPCDGPSKHGSLAIVDTGTGAVRQNGYFPFYNGSTIDRESYLLDVADWDGGRLIATGFSTYPDDHAIVDLRSKQRYATIGFISDRIFSDRFE